MFLAMNSFSVKSLQQATQNDRVSLDACNSVARTGGQRHHSEVNAVHSGACAGSEAYARAHDAEHRATMVRQSLAPWSLPPESKESGTDAKQDDTSSRRDAEHRGTMVRQSHSPLTTPTRIAGERNRCEATRHIQPLLFCRLSGGVTLSELSCNPSDPD